MQSARPGSIHEELGPVVAFLPLIAFVFIGGIVCAVWFARTRVTLRVVHNPSPGIEVRSSFWGDSGTPRFIDAGADAAVERAPGTRRGRTALVLRRSDGTTTRIVQVRLGKAKLNRLVSDLNEALRTPP